MGKKEGRKKGGMSKGREMRDPRVTRQTVPASQFLGDRTDRAEFDRTTLLAAAVFNFSFGGHTKDGHGGQSTDNLHRPKWPGLDPLRCTA